ncbi:MULTISPECIES: hypothetical protein [Prevotellaceae]|uniref:hypothetical protein n=1 Tax=Leyella stercorea TaxID=363265 RepID=UPI001F3A5221|nr:MULTISPECIES: hypothetical protein [Prevotellaceae]MCF2644265.1 hypothetical protein [Leyella stercorea]MCI6130836.1 hypothetical protein [Prevotella sp.]MCI7372406.1 hypothetical protein [Prevotella sp.]MDD6199128.1 hypothetical protein [Prevotella sp.]MDY4645399.1 hypothetical protein [Prevotella sp.]
MPPYKGGGLCFDAVACRRSETGFCIMPQYERGMRKTPWSAFLYCATAGRDSTVS